MKTVKKAQTGSKRPPRFVVLGGCGAMGRVAVRDLFTYARGARIVIADFNEARARAYARSFRSARVTAAFADARRPRALSRVLRGCNVVLNCTQHDFNLRVMAAALVARCHYLDLGGLFTFTRKQLKLDAHFERAGLLAILGVGGSPGVTNVLARLAVDELLATDPARRIESIQVRSAWHDPRGGEGEFSFGFSPQTVVEELTLPAFEFAREEFREILPRTRWERHAYPRPFGRIWSLATRHSEVASLPDSFGCRFCDFKLGYDRGFVREFERRWKAGWRVDDFKPLVTPREKPRDLEILRVMVSGRTKVVTADCVARARPEWNATAGDIDTGCPPSIVAQMIADGLIERVGVWAPELVIPTEAFVAELRRRGMTVKVRVAGRAKR